MNVSARFVWLVTNGAPHAQKWPADILTGPAGERSRTVVAIHPITDQQMALTINELAALFPPPALNVEIL